MSTELNLGDTTEDFEFDTWQMQPEVVQRRLETRQILNDLLGKGGEPVETDPTRREFRFEQERGTVIVQLNGDTPRIESAKTRENKEMPFLKEMFKIKWDEQKWRKMSAHERWQRKLRRIDAHRNRLRGNAA